MSILQLKKTLEQYIRKFAIFEQSKVAVGISGGSDSLGLALLLAKYCPNFDITLLTVDHSLRAESADEAKLVQQWAQIYNLEHHTLVWQDHPSNGNLMENARSARYRLLQDFCTSSHISYLFLGHTLDDQVETFFINLERGSGLDGLSAMDEFTTKGKLNLCRPLINHHREEIRAFLKSINQKWIDDPSNENDKFLRVKIRKLFKDDQLFFSRINLAISNLKRARDFVKAQTVEIYNKLVNVELVGVRYFSQSDFNRLAEEIRFRLINRVLEDIAPQAKKRRLESVKILDQLISTGKLKNHNLSKVGISAKDGVVYFYPLINACNNIDLKPNQTFNFGGYQIETHHIKTGLTVGLATKEQYLEYKKTKKSFSSRLPYNMILNIPVVTELEKIVFIPHIRNTGLIDLEIYIKSYFKSFV